MAPDTPDAAIDLTPRLLAELGAVAQTLNHILYAVVAIGTGVLVAWSR